MDLKVFLPKTPVSLSAQLHRDVTNGDYSGITLTNDENKSRRYFVAGFSVEELESLGIHDSTQLSQLRSMDDAGSIDLVTFESDPQHIGFILTSDLHNVISKAGDDVGLLSKADWSIYEIENPTSDTPFKGSLEPVMATPKRAYKVPFKELPSYFEHVVKTGELTPTQFERGDITDMVDSNKEIAQLSEEELRALLEEKTGADTMDMAIEEEKSEDDLLYEGGEEYYQAQLVKEEAERRRKEEEARQRQQLEKERRRREQEEKARQAKSSAQSGEIVIPPLKSFDTLVDDVLGNENVESDVQQYYLRDLAQVQEYVDSMNIDPNVFNSFDAEGRRDLMVAMNREREKLVAQAVSRLRREAIVTETAVNVDSSSADADVRENHLALYVEPLQTRKEAFLNSIDNYEEERQQELNDGFDEWWSRVQSSPEEVYREIYEDERVHDAVEQEKKRLSETYQSYRDERQEVLDNYIREYVQSCREDDVSKLAIDWSESARIGSQSLSDRVDSVRSQMENRRMMLQMKEMYSRFEQQASSQMQAARSSQVSAEAQNRPQVTRPSQVSHPGGTVQQQNPAPKVQAPSVEEQVVEEPVQNTDTNTQSAGYPDGDRPAQEQTETVSNDSDSSSTAETPVADTTDTNDSNVNVTVTDDVDVDESTVESNDDSDIEDYDDDIIEDEESLDQPVVRRPQDMYPDGSPADSDEEWGDFEDTFDPDSEWDDFDEFDDEGTNEDNDELLDDLPDEFDDDDTWEDEGWDDDELDDFEAEEKPRKKGLRGLFSRR